MDKLNPTGAFKDALRRTLANEGGYSNDPRDPGGRTLWGISETAHPELWRHGPPSREEAERVYWEQYWLPLELDGIDGEHVRWEAFDTAVNVGVHRAGKMLQAAYNDLRPQHALLLKVDGMVGPVTRRTVNLFTGRGAHYERALVNMMDWHQGAYYRARASQAFKVGWFALRIGNAFRAG